MIVNESCFVGESMSIAQDRGLRNEEKHGRENGNGYCDAGDK